MEGKLRKNSDKIEPFPISTENNESVDDMDEALRQQLIKAADEYEKILNSDPSLDYIDEMEESPELFAAVIQQLKDEKKWVDEDEEDLARKQEASETAMGEEKKDNVQIEENREKVYEMLSDEDRKALAIGRRKMAQRRRDKVLKYAGFAAMICLCLFGVSMTSDANRKYMLSLWNTLNSQNINVSIESSDNLVDSNNQQENEMNQEIQNKTDVKPLKLMYKPNGMKFLSYNINERQQYVVIQYEYFDTIINVVMCKKGSDVAGYQVFDGEYKEAFETYVSTEQAVTVSEVQNPNGEKEYVTQFENNNNYYSISAIMSREDFTKMLNNIYF